MPSCAFELRRRCRRDHLASTATRIRWIVRDGAAHRIPGMQMGDVTSDTPKPTGSARADT